MRYENLKKKNQKFEENVKLSQIPQIVGKEVKIYFKQIGKKEMEIPKVEICTPGKKLFFFEKIREILN